MTPRGIHIIVCVVLSLLFTLERGLPCLDDCEWKAEDSCAHEAIAEPGSGDGQDDAPHHCGHCSCICHTAAIGPAGGAVIATFLPSSTGTLHLSVVPTPPVSSPDHIPLV